MWTNRDGTGYHATVRGSVIKNDCSSKLLLGLTEASTSPASDKPEPPLPPGRPLNCVSAQCGVARVCCVCCVQ